MSIYVDANTRIQVLETMMDLPMADKEQCVAFIVSVLSSARSFTYFRPDGPATWVLFRVINIWM